MCVIFFYNSLWLCAWNWCCSIYSISFRNEDRDRFIFQRKHDYHFGCCICHFFFYSHKAFYYMRHFLFNAVISVAYRLYFSFFFSFREFPWINQNVLRVFRSTYLKYVITVRKTCTRYNVIHSFDGHILGRSCCYLNDVQYYSGEKKSDSSKWTAITKWRKRKAWWKKICLCHLGNSIKFAKCWGIKVSKRKRNMKLW